MDHKNISPPTPIPNKSLSGGAGANPDQGKRKRMRQDDNVSIWDLPRQTSLGWSPYLVISSADESQKKITSLSVFAIGKAFRACGIPKPKKVSPQGSGDLLVEVANVADSVQLRKCTSFGGIPVSVEPHRSLNTSRGVVKSRDLDGCTEEEMVQEIEGVTHARRVIVRRDGKEIRTNTWILSFDCPRPPTKLTIEYLELEVKPYIPNPMRCFNCQRFGHTKLRCRRNAVCPRCGKEGHTEESCTSVPRCPNCQQGGHPAYSRECPKYSQEKAILTHRAKFGGTSAQAKAAVFPMGLESTQKTTYADAAKAGPRNADNEKVKYQTVKAPRTSNKNKKPQKRHDSQEEDMELSLHTSPPKPLSTSAPPGPSPSPPSSSQPSSSSPPSSSSHTSSSSTSSSSPRSSSSPPPTTFSSSPPSSPPSHHPSSNKAPPPTPRTRSPSSTRIQDSGPPPPPHSPSKKGCGPP
ncbi:uncharacterized protein LOC106012003 [Aplysia californica]|uniref:Uncharacterized protein LOC106012003 n=1 Tax=Aplysia californica TaxID=6500 RepID=A0ABM1A1K7_APLCA|nr:uncharacterized protein LOC106012003 [Aplysia californica]